MKVILTMATSANGIIATKTGSEDFLSHGNWLQFVKLAKKVGCFIWGRKTYDAVSKWPSSYLDDLAEVKKIIISHSNVKLQPGFSLASSPEDALQQLEKAGFSTAIITGGSTINSEFARKNLIDEVILDVNAVIVGEGIPLFAPGNFEIKLELVGMQKIDDEIVELRYRRKQ